MKPDSLFSAEEIASLCGNLTQQPEIIRAEQETGSAQTGFCYTSTPCSIVLATNRGWLKKAFENRAVSLVITSPKVCQSSTRHPAVSLLVCNNPEEVFYYIHNLALHQRCYKSASSNTPMLVKQKVSSSVRIHSSAVLEGEITLEEQVEIGPFCYLKGPVTIGRGTIVRESCSIGNDGLFSKEINGNIRHMTHFGGLKIGENCQIHAGARIARSAMFQSNTLLEDEVSIGVESVVGHDCHVGSKTTVASTATILGRAHIEPGCWIGAGSLVSNSCHLGQNSSVKLGAVVVQDLPPSSVVSGNFARPHHKTLRDLMQ